MAVSNNDCVCAPQPSQSILNETTLPILVGTIAFGSIYIYEHINKILQSKSEKMSNIKNLYAMHILGASAKIIAPCKLLFEKVIQVPPYTLPLVSILVIAKETLFAMYGDDNKKNSWFKDKLISLGLDKAERAFSSAWAELSAFKLIFDIALVALLPELTFYAIAAVYIFYFYGKENHQPKMENVQKVEQVAQHDVSDTDDDTDDSEEVLKDEEKTTASRPYIYEIDDVKRAGPREYEEHEYSTGLRQ